MQRIDQIVCELVNSGKLSLEQGMALAAAVRFVRFSTDEKHIALFKKLYGTETEQGLEDLTAFVE